MKNIMKQWGSRFLSLIFFILILNINQSKASHSIGAEFFYTYVSPNVYEVTYTFYRDCHGISPTTSIGIEITNECGYPPQTIFLPQFGIETDVQTTCPTLLTECHGGSYIGMQKWTYKGNVTLNGPCVWKIGHSVNARTAAITTINNASLENLYVFCIIDNTNGNINNSPVFFNDPLLIHSVNQLITIENSVYDIDNDSLVFSLITPRWGPNEGDTIVFYNGYSRIRPFISSSQITLDQQTGMIVGIATQTDVTVYALLISEYRNGILIGQIERDMNIAIGNAVNSNPEITGFFGTSNFNMDVFAGQQNCFQIASSDSDPNTQTEMDINCSIPGMSYFVSGGTMDTGFFCWNPSLSDTIDNPYCFTVSVKDDNCPFSGYQARSYCLNVRLPVSITEFESDGISIYPNPFNSELRIKSDHKGKSELSIFDIQGRKIVSKIIDSIESVHDFQQLENGMYVVSIAALETNQIFYQRMMKVN